MTRDSVMKRCPSAYHFVCAQRSNLYWRPTFDSNSNFHGGCFVSRDNWVRVEEIATGVELTGTIPLSKLVVKEGINRSHLTASSVPLRLSWFTDDFAVSLVVLTLCHLSPIFSFFCDFFFSIYSYLFLVQ